MGWDLLRLALGLVLLAMAFAVNLTVSLLRRR